MGTLVKKTDDKIAFDGTAKSWPPFKEAMLKWADAEGFPWTLDAGQGICNIFLASSAAAAKVATRSAGAAPSTFTLDITQYSLDTIKAELLKTSVMASVFLSLRTHRKDRLGANYAEHEKLSMT